MVSLFGLCFDRGVFFLIYNARVRVSRRMLARQHGCDVPPIRRSMFSFLRIGYYRSEDAQAVKEHRTLPLGHALHQKYGKTFAQPGVFSTTLRTVEAENMHAILGSQAKAFGVEPFRLAGMEPFCGRGLLTTDGQSWQRSRSLLRPSFQKSNLSDLSDFASAIDRLLAMIPRDGSAIDLQPLISLMVGDGLNMKGARRMTRCAVS